MSELNLLLCGCVVSFIALGGAYVYLREAFERQQSAERVRYEERIRQTHHRDAA